MYHTVSPQQGNPSRNRIVEFPMPESIYLQLFPDAQKTNSKDIHKFATYKQSRRIYKKIYEKASDLDDLFGENWWRFHFKTNIGILFGKIEFYLIEQKLNFFESICCKYTNCRRKFSFNV